MGKSKIPVIIAREYARRVKKRSFIFTTIFAPVLMAALFIVPMAIITLVSYDTAYKVKVSDNSGIVMPYLTDGENLHFEDVTGADIETLKGCAGEDREMIVLVVSPLDRENNVSLALYSEKQIDIETRNRIKSMAEDAVEKYKISSYNIPDLNGIIERIKPDVNVSTFLIDNSTGEEKVSQTEIYMVIGYIAGSLIYIFIFMFGGMVMRSVVEEKSNRIVEVILSSVKPFQLMMGKIIGVAAVGLTQFLIWIVLTAVLVGVAIPLLNIDEVAKGAAVQTEQVATVIQSGVTDLPSSAQNLLNAIAAINFTKIIGAFLVYFLLGYLLYSGMFAAVGSAVDNETDTSQLSLPISVPLIIGFIVMMHSFQYPDSPISVWSSIIPFTSPMVMMARITYGVPLWQILLSISLLLLTFIFLTYLSGKIYRTGILMYGKRASWKDLIKWIKYKN